MASDQSPEIGLPSLNSGIASVCHVRWLSFRGTTTQLLLGESDREVTLSCDGQDCKIYSLHNLKEKLPLKTFRNQ